MLKAGSGVGLLAPAARAIVVDRMNGTRVREMLRSVVGRMTLAAGMAAAGGAEAFAWWDRCDCDAMRYGYYGPAPVYVYDHNRGPTWTSNGWTYPPVSSFYPAPPPPPAPPANGCGALEHIFWPLTRLAGHTC